MPSCAHAYCFPSPWISHTPRLARHHPPPRAHSCASLTMRFMVELHPARSQTVMATLITWRIMSSPVIVRVPSNPTRAYGVVPDDRPKNTNCLSSLLGTAGCVGRHPMHSLCPRGSGRVL